MLERGGQEWVQFPSDGLASKQERLSSAEVNLLTPKTGLASWNVLPGTVLCEPQASGLEALVCQPEPTWPSVFMLRLLWAVIEWLRALNGTA